MRTRNSVYTVVAGETETAFAADRNVRQHVALRKKLVPIHLFIIIGLKLAVPESIKKQETISTTSHMVG